MEDKTIEECWNEAWSFPGPDPPHDAELIDEKSVNGTTYRLYRMLDGTFLYDTERGHAFALEMVAAQKRHNLEKIESIIEQRGILHGINRTNHTGKP